MVHVVNNFNFNFNEGVGVEFYLYVERVAESCEEVLSSGPSITGGSGAWLTS
jgi:hypothetical protein